MKDKHGTGCLEAALRMCCWCLLFVCCVDGQTRVPSLSARVNVNTQVVEGKISPMLYGQFSEFMFGGIKDGLYAELLRQSRFEESPTLVGLPRYWERDPDDRNDDPAMRFAWDGEVHNPASRLAGADEAKRALSVTLDSNDGQRRGIRQSAIPIRKGLPYHGFIWLKTSDVRGRVTVALEADWTGGESYATAEVGGTAGEWKRYDFTLTPSKSDRLAKFVILFSGRSRFWIDQVSLVPANAVDGVRADVFARIKALRPAFLRWPGGNVAQDYHWIWGVGPRDQRVTWTNLSWANAPEPSDFGTDEYIRLCRNIGAEPSITLNIEGRGATAAEAAAWVEYVNGDATSKYGAMRAANGTREPFRVKYWELGNEIWGDWVRGHTDAITYSKNALQYAAAVKAADPSIKLIAVGDNNMDWNRTVLTNAGNEIDYLAVHHYYGLGDMKGDARNLMARPLHFEKFYKELASLINELVPAREIKLVINEWNTSLPLPRQHSMESALYAARLMNVFERSNNVAMTAVSDLVNGWSGGVIQASRHDVFVTPTYLVNELYAQRLGSERLQSTVTSPTFDTSLEGSGVPFLDVVASRSPSGKLIYLKCVNTDPEHDLRTTINIAGTSVAATGTIETLNGATLYSANTFSTPHAVSLHKAQVKAGTSFVVTLPRHSVSVITLKVGK